VIGEKRDGRKLGGAPKHREAASRVTRCAREAVFRLSPHDLNKDQAKKRRCTVKRRSAMNRDLGIKATGLIHSAEVGDRVGCRLLQYCNAARSRFCNQRCSRSPHHRHQALFKKGDDCTGADKGQGFVPRAKHSDKIWFLTAEILSRFLGIPLHF